MLEVFTKTTFILAFHKGNALEFKKKKKKSKSSTLIMYGSFMKEGLIN